MDLFDTQRSVIQELSNEDWHDRGIRVLVKRDDQIDEEVSGNKWRKLKYILELAASQHKTGLLTLGGAYSNHLLATAAACAKAGMKAVGLVRGEELSPESNPNLQRCTELGMQLVFVSRDEYAERYEKERQEIWKQHYPEYLFVPEGGATYHGMIGCQEIATEIPGKIDHVFVAQGTTTTSCGLLLGFPETTQLHVVPVLKGFDSLAEMRSLLYTFLLDWEVADDYLKRIIVHNSAHFGGYAKVPVALKDFIRLCEQQYNLPLDGVYTGKAFWALTEALQSPEFDGSTVLFVHTGGLKNGVLKND